MPDDIRMWGQEPLNNLGKVGSESYHLKKKHPNMVASKHACQNHFPISVQAIRIRQHEEL